MTYPLQGKRVHDTTEMLGDGTVIEHNAVEALIDWDLIPGPPMWESWRDIELVEA
jgi:hypothetical protein